MKEEVSALNCGRETDLIAFLYGELNDLESQTFQRHLRDCAACDDQLHALKSVRESVVAWRNESLGDAISRDESATRVSRQQPSASAALRAFLNLSPLWVKGAFAFATVVFCLFLGLAVARWREVPPGTGVAAVNSPASSEQKLNALVQQRVQDELRRIKSGADQALHSSVAIKGRVQRNPVARVKRGDQLAGGSDQQARRPLSSVERAQLASDLRLVSQGNDTELDLLDDGINK